MGLPEDHLKCPPCKCSINKGNKYKFRVLWMTVSPKYNENLKSSNKYFSPQYHGYTAEVCWYIPR